MNKKLVVKSDHSIEIVATKEVVWGSCRIIEAMVDDAGLLAVAHCGGTDIDWDSQETVINVDGWRCFLDEAGNEYLENELELIGEEEDEA